MKLGDFIPIVISPSPEESPDLPRSSSSRRRRFGVPSLKKINWVSLLRSGRNWAREPINMALLVWLLAVAICLLILFLLMTGILNGAIPQSSRRKNWIEVVNQILNALFAIICIYQHPKLAHHLFLLLRWLSGDAEELRKLYSKKIKSMIAPSPGAHERLHLGIVILLLHITCFSQYVICGLFWAFDRSYRPEYVLNVFIGLGIICPVFSGVYVLYGPLGRRERARGGAAEAAPLPEALQPPREWVGGEFDCCNDKIVAYLSFFCTVCVFGWNMERLGFGNMYVHIATFALVIIAPFLVFNAAAMNIDNEVIKKMMAISGIVLSFFGLVYGGFWRTQMRRKLTLPANPLCCGYSNVTDCFLWLFCWPCSLAQEVRTGNAYGVKKGSPLPEEEETGGAVGGTLRSLSISELPRIWAKPASEFPLRSLSSPGRISGGGGGLPACGNPARVVDCSNEVTGFEVSPPRPPMMNSQS